MKFTPIFLLRYICLAASLFLLSACAISDGGYSPDFAAAIGPSPQKHIFKMDGYCVWCNGVLKGDDGKYHMFFSRWELSRGHNAWVTHSEVAHAVSDNLFGPYEFSDVALPPRGSQYWDGEVTHNPHAIKVGKKYYLYYTGNTGTGYWPKVPATQMSTGVEQWWVNRNNQRVGVAVADSPYGPWKRFDAPIILPYETEMLTAVPTVSERADGGYMLVFKSVVKNPGMKRGVVRHYTALSENPLGPWRRIDKPFIESPKTDFPIDDHVEWRQNGKYFCIAKDHGAKPSFSSDSVKVFDPDALTEHGRALILFESADGFDWKLSKNSLVHKFEITFADGSHYEFDRLEMPKVYLEDGKVKAIFLAAKPRGKEESFSVALEVKERGE